MTAGVMAVSVRADMYDLGWQKGGCGNKRPTQAWEITLNAR